MHVKVRNKTLRAVRSRGSIVLAIIQHPTGDNIIIQQEKVATRASLIVGVNRNIWIYNLQEILTQLNLHFHCLGNEE
jgi:DNA-binding protein Fis